MFVRPYFVSSLVVLLFAIVVPAPAGEYTFHKIADATPQIGLGLNDPTPSINNDGTVAYYGHPEQLPLGVYIGTVDSVTPIDVHPQGFSFNDVPVINNAGQVAYTTAGFLSSDGIYIGTTSGITPVVERELYGKLRSNGLSFADDGTIHVASIYNPVNFGEPSEKFVYKWNGGDELQLIDSLTQQVGLPFVEFEETASSDNGTIVYSWQSEGFLEKQIIRIWNGESTLIASTDTQGGFGSFAVNDSGLVAFVFDAAFNSTLDSGVYLGDGITTTQIVGFELGGPFTRFDSVSINNHDDIAFLAGFSDDGGLGGEPGGSGGSGGFGGGSTEILYWEGILTGPDPIEDLVIRTGQTLDGNRVSRIRFGSNGLNDFGQIAFYAEFIDGQAAQYLAIPVPEPSTIILTISGIIGIAGYRLLRRSAIRPRP